MATASRWRWTFSLRTMFVVVALLAIPMAWVAWKRHETKLRQECFLRVWLNGGLEGYSKTKLRWENGWPFYFARGLTKIKLHENMRTDEIVNDLQITFPGIVIERCNVDHKAKSEKPLADPNVKGTGSGIF